MDSFFAWCAVISGVAFLGQFALSLFGHAADVDLDGVPDVDVDLDLDGGTSIEHSAGQDIRFVGMFSLRAILAGTTVFGLTGLAAVGRSSESERMLMSLGAGVGTMYLMGLLVRMLHRLEHDGTVKLEDAVGCTGLVYLTIPPSQTGAGKVTLNIKGRTMEYLAMTEHEALTTGTPVEVTHVVAPETVIVRLLSGVRVTSEAAHS